MDIRSLVFGCPRCYSLSLYLSRPRSFAEEHILPLLLLRPVRCAECTKRSYRPVFVPAKARPEATVQHRAAAA